jgi:hypothetical protein
VHSPYEFREPMTGRKARDFNVAYAVGKWWLERARLADIVKMEGIRSEAYETQRSVVEYWRSFCEKEFGILLK